MYCPYCGIKNSDGNSSICSDCGKDLPEDEVKFHKKKNQIFRIALLGLFFSIIIGIVAYFFKPLCSLLYLSWLCFIVLLILIISIILLLLNDYIVTFSGESRKCPGCLGKVPDEDFCIECGHNLKDILAFYQGEGKGSDLEITQEELIIYGKKSDNDSSTVRLTPRSYIIENIENLEFSKCGYTKYNCIRFSYEGKNKEYNISKNMINELKEFLSDI